MRIIDEQSSYSPCRCPSAAHRALFDRNLADCKLEDDLKPATSGILSWNTEHGSGMGANTVSGQDI